MAYEGLIMKQNLHDIIRSKHVEKVEHWSH